MLRSNVIAVNLIHISWEVLRWNCAPSLCLCGHPLEAMKPNYPYLSEDLRRWISFPKQHYRSRDGPSRVSSSELWIPYNGNLLNAWKYFNSTIYISLRARLHLFLGVIEPLFWAEIIKSLENCDFCYIIFAFMCKSFEDLHLSFERVIRFPID